MVYRTTPILSDMPANPTRDVFQREKTLAKWNDLNQEINAEIDELVDAKREIEKFIKQIDNE